MISKQQFITSILNKIEEELSSISQAAQSTRQAATHEESKAEDSHDTRSIEASYLAGAQAARVRTLEQQILYFKHTSFKELKESDSIIPGAYITLECENRMIHTFFALHAGGLTFEVTSSEGKRTSIQVVTPTSPLGEALVGRKRGDLIEVESKTGIKEYVVQSVF